MKFESEFYFRIRVYARAQPKLRVDFKHHMVPRGALQRYSAESSARTRTPGHMVPLVTEHVNIASNFIYDSKAPPPLLLLLLPEIAVK